MLDWCKNLQLNREQKAQLTFQAEVVISSQKRYRKLVPPQSSRTLLNPRTGLISSRKGIKTHFNKSLQTHKQTQTAMNFTSNFSTQTPRCPSRLSINPQHALSLRPSDPSATRIAHCNGQPNTQSKCEKYHYLQQTKRISDYKPAHNSQNRQTKASFNMIEPQDPFLPFSNQPQLCFQDYEYINPSFKQNTISMQTQKQNGSAQNNICNEIFNLQIESNFPNKISLKSSNSFRDKCKIALRNVESEYKLSEKKKFQRIQKNTPLRRILFQDRDTIISKYNDSNIGSQKSIPVQQSFIIDPQACSLFTSWHQVHAHPSYTLSIAFEGILGFMVSIKEVSILLMPKISSELSVYKQIQKSSIKGFLSLYQTQIDKDSFLFIKQPFSSTLVSHLQNCKSSNILLQIMFLLTQIHSIGLFLRTFPRIQDFVICLGSIKLHNLEVLGFQEDKEVNIQKALHLLQQSINDRQQ